MPSRAELLALAAGALLAVPIVAGYAIDQLGFGIASLGALTAGAAGAAACCAMLPKAGSDRAGTIIGALTFTATGVFLVWLGWPAFLPGGSGPDLAHHLLLVDYLQQHGSLVHDPEAWRELGEMASYTPGLHLLTVMVASATGTDGFFVIYPLVALSVALKFTFFALITWRLTRHTAPAAGLVIGGVGLLLHLPTLTLQSFTRDSFLAQVMSELFAIVMLWTLVAWAERPARWLLIAAGTSGAAVFLTWPLWSGPLVVALALTIGLAATLPFARRVTQFVIALAPVAVAALWHTLGRTDAVSIVATSGAVAPPSLPPALAWLPVLAIAGLFVSWRRANSRTLIWLSLGLIVQAAALWGVARVNAAATPYMAIKMTYLMVYPTAAAALLAIAALARSNWAAWPIALAIVISAARGLAGDPRPAAVIDADLFAAGRWARTHLPLGCVDYLVANEYTAYWLHLAVLRHPRLAERSANDELYLTEPSFARWIEGRSDVPYAMARWSVLPIEIRERVRVLHRVGDAAVIEGTGDTPRPAAHPCASEGTRSPIRSEVPR